MSTMKITRPPSNPIQRLSSRLLRQRGYSLSQISAITGLSSAVVHYATVNLDAEDLQKVTLDEVGAPGNTMLFSALVAAASDYAGQHLALRQVGEPRGNSSPSSTPTPATAQAA